jgi:hypothetical protein
MLQSKIAVQHPRYLDVGVHLPSKINDAVFSWAQEIVDLNGSWIIWQEG